MYESISRKSRDEEHTERNLMKRVKEKKRPNRGVLTKYEYQNINVKILYYSLIFRLDDGI